MKSIRLVALSAILTLSAFCAVLYSSCKKDACKGVTCQNGGVCTDGNCSCKSGIGGTNCETVYRALYANTYKGNGTDNFGGTYTDSKIVLTTGSDTSDYTKMSMQVLSGAGANIFSTSFNIVLANNTSSGSTFTVSSSVVDTFTYSGTGTINGSTCTLTLTEATPHAPAYIYTLSNYNKQ